MKNNILISLAAIILSFTSCDKPEEGGKDNPQPPAPSQEQITIPSTVDVTPVVPPEGGDAKITFTATAAWTASVISTKADSWVDVNPKSGDSGSAEITITTTTNDTYVERNATIQIKSGTQTKEVVLTQKQQDNITVTTDKVELGTEGGTFTIELKSNIDFSYAIEGDWIKYVSTKAYTDRTLTFTAEANESVQKREGSVTVMGGGFSETVEVYQSGEEPTLVISQNEYNLEAEGGSIVVEVTSNIAVTMAIPEDAAWITENSTKSVSTSTFHLDVAANETEVSRSAEITFSNEETGLSEAITVKQKGNIDFINSKTDFGVYTINESSVERLLVPSFDNHLQIGFVRDEDKRINTFRVQNWIGNAFCVKISYPGGKTVGETVYIDFEVLGSVNGIQSEKSYKITIEKIEDGKIWMRGDKFCFIVKE